MTKLTFLFLGWTLIIIGVVFLIVSYFAAAIGTSMSGEFPLQALMGFGAFGVMIYVGFMCVKHARTIK